MASNSGRSRSRTIALLILFFLSGAAALIYEVLWLKELGLLFGVTAHAAATTLAVFFLGLSAGGLVWGRRSALSRRPLRTYGLLELAIAASAVLYFWLLDLYYFVSPALLGGLSDRPGPLLLIKFGLALGVLFLPAFFMGGTLPVMGQYLVRKASDLGRWATALYAVNTFGAATGALAAGFFLPRWFGFHVSYWIAIGLNVVVAFVALRWSNLESPVEGRVEPKTALEGGERADLQRGINPRLLWFLAGASGFLTLALEVLWTRMFAQVLQNSVYTFSAILAVFLVALALGSVLAHALCRLRLSRRLALFLLLMTSGLAVSTSPLVFFRLTSGLEYVGGGLGWTAYVMSVFGATAAVVLIPGILIGSIFPYLMRHSEEWVKHAGKTIGELASVNTVAAIVGSLAAGFFLLEWFGLWNSLRLVAAAYLLLSVSVILPSVRDARSMLVTSLPVVGLILLATVLDYGNLPVVSVDRRQGEQLIWLREGSHGTVAVIRRGQDLRLKVNNHYLLGTAASTPNQRIQSWLPISLHPDPRRVFFLGMGTGITAGGALHYPVEKVVVTELNPDVVQAARTHFGPHLNGLFDDSRVRVAADDGRAYLAATDESFDVIIADIFLTYRAGVGSLYTREHFEVVRSRLAPGGMFVQWLPMFDLSSEEFAIIARTLLEVFPQVTLWRRGFSPRFPVFALIASSEPRPLDPAGFRSNLRRLVEQGIASPDLWLENIPLAAYAGNLSLDTDELENVPISTDDRRPLEYLSPITERNSKGAGTKSTLAWLTLADFCGRWIGEPRLRRDPYVSGVGDPGRREIEAGLALYRWETFRRMGLAEAAEESWRRYEALVAEALQPAP